MAKPEAYRILDEPMPSPLERLTVNPVWPFFSAMFAGSWLSWPWFLVNSVALGSRGRNGDIALVLGGMLATAGIVLGVASLGTAGVITTQVMPYALLAPLGMRVTLAYALYLRQARTFELFEHFGGAAKNGLPVVFAGALVRTAVLGKTVTFWTLVFG
jgi:ABC-type transport system involved in multi-copper enzyme maturation permease subunit